MKSLTGNPFIIFTVCQKDESDIKNEFNTRVVLNQLNDKGIKFKQVKINNEDIEAVGAGFLVPASQFEKVRELTNFYSQADFLIVDTQREAKIYDNVTNVSEAVGTFQRADKLAAEGEGVSVFDPEFNQYWVIK